MILSLWVVKNRPSPLLWPLAYTTACPWYTGGMKNRPMALFRARHNIRRTPRCARRSPPSVAALFFTLRDSYGWQHCRPVCRKGSNSPRIAFFGLPRLHSTFPLVWKNQSGLATRWWKKIQRYLDSFWHNSLTWRTDGRTDRHCMRT